MSIEVVTKDELVLLREDLINQFEKLLKKHVQASMNRKWLRSSEVRKLLGISSGTLQNMRINGTLPFTRLNGVIYYNWEDINKIMVENMIGENTS